MTAPRRILPTLHLLFGLDEGATSPALNDYLRGECAIEQAVRDLTQRFEAKMKSKSDWGSNC